MNLVKAGEMYTLQLIQCIMTNSIEYFRATCIAWCIADKEDTTVKKLFLQKLKDRCPCAELRLS